MPKIKVYTGVGSRNPPPIISQKLAVYSRRLARNGYMVRTGDAIGCDATFAANRSSIVYGPKDVIDEPDHWSYAEVKKHIPNDRSGFDNWTPYVKALLARNMLQVLGPNGNQKSRFLLCWAPSTYYLDSSSGGTGWAIRAATAHMIPVYNLFSEEQDSQFQSFLSTLEK